MFVSALCFWDERHGSGRRTFVEGGPWAVEQFLEGLHSHRFIQSFKTFAASGTFQETRSFASAFGSRISSPRSCGPLPATLDRTFASMPSGS